MSAELSDFECARRIAFIVGAAANGLGLRERRGPDAVRALAIDILDAGMAEPAKVDPSVYGVAYIIAGVET